MSITVYVECEPTGRFSATCHESGEVLTGTSYDDILLQMSIHKYGCTDCETYGIYSSSEMDVDVSVNMANGNALTVFTKMGIELDFAGGGTMDPDEFLGYVLVANALDDGSGLRPVRDGNVIECGYAPGYIDQRLVQLAHVAIEAKKRNRLVVWN